MTKLIFAFRSFSNALNEMHFLRATCFEEGTDIALPLISNFFSMKPLHNLPKEQALTLTYGHALQCDVIKVIAPKKKTKNQKKKKKKTKNKKKKKKLRSEAEVTRPAW
jgi:hypothetical protein